MLTVGLTLEARMGEAEITRETLVDFLCEQGVSTATWGTGKAKSLDDLLEEVQEGESQLIVFEEGLRRVTPIDQIEVRYQALNGSLYRLVEQKQVFNDGRERVRSLPCFLGEKIKAGEDLAFVVVRGIGEELGIEIDVSRVTALGHEYQETESFSYPGLITRYDKYTFLVNLADGEYRSEGYMEDDGKKYTYFVWQPVEETPAV